MKKNTVARWILAGCLLVAGSCASTSQSPMGSASDPSFNTQRAEETFTQGFTNIVERALEPVSAASVAIEGIRGLAAIDSSVFAEKAGSRVVLTVSNRKIAEYQAPADKDIEGWSRLTVQAALAFRNASSEMHNADAEKIYQAVFEATLAKLDKFSRYAGAKEARSRRAGRNGFGGIGVKFDVVADGALINEVLDDSPAAEVGIKVGDVLTRVGGEPVKGLEREDVADLLRGPVSADVQVTVRKGGGSAVANLHVKRTLIVPQTVTASVHDGYAEFKIASFNQRTAASVTAALKSARQQLGPSMKGVILDLRGNPGGLLDQAVQVADLFMASGPIVSTHGRHPLASQFYEAHPGDMGEDLPVVLLVDGKSASASEILAGALQDAGRAVVIGTNSYGKGTVQTVIHMPNDGEMTLTWSRFHTPSGYALHGLGVLPTICTADDNKADAAFHKPLPPKLASTVTGTMARWRTAKLEDTELRADLRSTCPAAKHGDSKVEMEMAEKLLDDQPAFSRALAISATPRPVPAVTNQQITSPLQQISH